MPFNLSIIPETHYLHVSVSGEANYQNACELWRAIANAAQQHQCFNILGEQSMRNVMPTTDAWNHQSIFLDMGITSKYKIAWVDTNPRIIETTRFIGTVLHNRHIGYGKIFSDVDTAKEWLMKKTLAATA